MKALEGLQKIPPDWNVKQLEGFEGLYSLRVGTYRVIYEYSENFETVIVLAIGPRGDVYNYLNQQR